MTVVLKPDMKPFPEIHVLGRFDFTCNREFRDASRQLGDAAGVTVKMDGTTYVDSSALGMMLLLREQVPEVRISGANAQVKKVLEIANFEKLFAVVD